ncbi:hypothetical protein [Paractinoplanes bogorensis]|uniref:hypothetical protein n=1 Tax=Paractinoplanes bogorensis TaxID=1610840 RepID=UPI001C03B7C4|nr:hypothetical protein [Actinoplanes bogorensis]
MSGVHVDISAETATSVVGLVRSLSDQVAASEPISQAATAMLDRLSTVPGAAEVRNTLLPSPAEPPPAEAEASPVAASAEESLSADDEQAFWDAVYPQLFDSNDKPRSLGWELLNAGHARDIRQRTTHRVASALLDVLAEKAVSTGSLPRVEHVLVPACVAVIHTEHADLVAEAIGLVVRQAAPSSVQVTLLTADTGRYESVVRQLLLRAITGLLDAASVRNDRVKAASCVEAAATLAENLTQAQTKSLWDRFESFNLESSLALDELRARADPTRRPDLAGLSTTDRTALLNAAQAFQAQTAADICKRNRTIIVEQARTWLAQQLGSKVSEYRAPAVSHPATQHPRNRLNKRDVEDAIAGNQPAVARCRQALEPFLVRGRSMAAEEWDAYLDAQASRLPDAADKWRRMTRPSPEVCWNLAVFDTKRKFAGVGAYKHLDEGLKSWRADTDMVLLGIWLALQATEDGQSGDDEPTRFFTTWAREVPEPRVLLAALAMANTDIPTGFDGAEVALRHWGQLADPVPLRFDSGQRSAPSMVDEVRKESRYTQRWQRCLLAGMAAKLGPAPRQTVLVALAETSEKDPDHTVANETWARVIEYARDRLDQQSEELVQLERRVKGLAEGDNRRPGVRSRIQHTKKGLSDAKYAFRAPGSGALRFAAKWRDERLARSVKEVLDHHAIPTSKEQDKLLSSLLPGGPVQPPPNVRPEIAELLPKLTAASDPASVAALARSVESALVYVGVDTRVRELVHQVFSALGQLSEGVRPEDARDLLDRVGRIAAELKSSDAGEESLAALLGAVRRASDFAVNHLVEAPPPHAALPAYWVGLSREAEPPQAVVEVSGTREVELQQVELSGGVSSLALGNVAAGESYTVAVPVAVDLHAPQESVDIQLDLAWSWGYVTGRRRSVTVTAPVSSWDALLADSGVAGLEIPDEFVINEPLSRSQVVSGLFQGRGDHLEQVLRNYVDRLPAVPVCFHGIRKVGKSSLLNKVIVELADAGRRVDLVTAQGLQPAHQTLGAIVANLCRRISGEARLPLPAVPPLPDNPTLFLEEFLDAYADLGKAASGSAPVLVIDEFQCLYTAECAPLLDLIRMMAESRRCGFIFAAVEGPGGLPTTTGLLVEPRRVDFLDATEVTQLVKSVLSGRPVIVPDDVHGVLFEESAGHPNFTSAIIKGALRLANAGRRNVICVNDVWDASQDIATNQQYMFDVSWFDASLLNEQERAVAVDLAHTLPTPRAWMSVADVIKRSERDVRSTLRALEGANVIESRPAPGGELQIRIRGGVLERYLRLLHGARLEVSPDKSKKPVGLFVDVENIIGAAQSPEELADQLIAFARRFGSVAPPVAVATRYSLSLVGWDLRAVEAAFVARQIRFEMPPPSIESKENAADMALQPFITGLAEQYNLAEVVIVSGDHFFIPTAMGLLKGVEGRGRAASGLRVHVVAGYSRDSKAGNFGTPWMATVDERRLTCQILGLDGPDLVLWDADEVLKDPAMARSVTPEKFQEEIRG